MRRYQNETLLAEWVVWLLISPEFKDRRKEEKFTSAILPRYMRRLPSVDNLIPVLYLKGISTGDFSNALSSILGKRAAGYCAAEATLGKGCGSRIATRTMVFKLCMEAEKTWRRINGVNVLAKVIQEFKFPDGVEEKAA